MNSKTNYVPFGNTKAIFSTLILSAFLFANFTPLPSTAATVSSAKLLATLKVKAEKGSTTYERDYFRHWIDADGDGCDTRDEVLQQESLTSITCDLIGGSWSSAYDGVKTNDASKFDIDHFIPLKEAWESGAYSWDENTRKEFANDLTYSASLIAVSASSNRSKSDRDPSQWMPKQSSYTCKYVASWIAVKYRWSLSVDAKEKTVLAAKAKACGKKANISKPTKATIVKGTTASPTDPETPTGGLDPRFASCAEAKRNGYNNYYTKGVNPEYKWYEDRDGDGVVCE